MDKLGSARDQLAYYQGLNAVLDMSASDAQRYLDRVPALEQALKSAVQDCQEMEEIARETWGIQELERFEGLLDLRLELLETIQTVGRLAQITLRTSRATVELALKVSCARM